MQKIDESPAVVRRRQFLKTCLCALCAPSALLEGNAEAAGQQSVASSSRPSTADVIDDLVAANRILAKEGIVDGFGHVSVRHPATPGRFLLSRSVAPESVTVADVMEYDLDGQPIDARGRASYLERFIHSEIYRSRRDVNAVVHCHTPSLLPFTVSSVPLRAVYHQSAFVAEGVPVFEIRDVAGMTDLLVKDAKLAAALARVLSDKPAVLMRGHGAVIVGQSIPHVVGRSVYLDINARAQIQAATLGGSVTYITPEEARQRTGADVYDRAWELWKKTVPK